MGADGSVSLKKTHTLPTVDERLGEEEGTSKEKNDAMALCRRNIGQMMWLTTRTRPDISACLGMLTSLMVRPPKQVKAYLVDLWRYLWTTMTHAMCTLPSPKASRDIFQKKEAQRDVSCARGGPKTGYESLKIQFIIQTYCVPE